jgi:hypothetical protein
MRLSEFRARKDVYEGCEEVRSKDEGSSVRVSRVRE